VRAALAALALSLLATAAHAHGRSTSSSAWTLDAEGARVVVRVQISDLQRALPEMGGVTPAELSATPGLRASVEGYLVERVALWAGDERCLPAGPVAERPSPDPTHVAFAWRLRCAAPGPRRLEIDPFLEALSAHLHLARIARPDGEVIERVFVLDQSRLALESPGAAPRGSELADYFRLGVEHIATGYDHLLFLLALLLVGVSLAEVATIVTGFTVAHSVTLALGVLGVVEPRPAAIEALIGLSIAVVALENFSLTSGAATRRRVRWALAAGLALAGLGAALGRVAVSALSLAGVGLFSLCYLGLLDHVARPARLRWLVAFVFGLVHGFGFAGLLTEIGLPPGRLAAALLGFNLGVEAGQLVAVALAWPLLRLLLGGAAGRRARVVQWGSTPILAAGIYWFLGRSLA